jgi:hypothetical protein
VRDEDGDFGINFVLPQEPWLSLAWDAGMRINRTQLSWRDVEPEPGVWTWEAKDIELQPFVDKGFHLHAILTLPPDWAKANPNGLMPRNLNLPWDHPENYWGRFAYATAEHFRGRIHSYEIWNEPDAEYWEGSAAEYYQLLRTAYQAIKAADPNAIVVMAGMALYLEPDFFPEVVRLAREDPEGPAHNHFFDAVSLHIYADAERIYHEVRNARALLDGLGLFNQTIWVTETQIPLWGEGGGPGEPNTGYATAEEAGWYVVESMANALAGGAERVMIFRFTDERIAVPFGLIRNDGSLRPGYTAFKVGATFFADTVEATREENGDLVIVRMTKENGGRVTVFWTRSGHAARFPVEAQAEAGLFVDAWGQVWLAEPTDGTYEIELAPAPGRNFDLPELYMVGGPPLVLVEDDREPPVATIEPPEPVPGKPNNLQLRWEGSDGELGTGIGGYDVEVRVSGGEWERWLIDTTDTEAVYKASQAGKYNFRVRARDRAGNESEWTEAEGAQAGVRGTAALMAQVVNLRGEGVEGAEIRLEDGQKYVTESGGWVLIEGLLPGSLKVARIDGGPHGEASPPKIELALTGKTFVTWTLAPPDNIVANGTFRKGLKGWETVPAAGEDVSVVELATGEAVLQLTGSRRAWGAPSVSVQMEVPSDMDAAILGFRYRLTESPHALRVCVDSGAGCTPVWQSPGPTAEWSPGWVEMNGLAGQELTITFELWGPKGARPGLVQIDDVGFGTLPPQPPHPQVD